MISDSLSIAQWWFLLFVIGIIFLPLTRQLFPSFLDSGYACSKLIGTILVSYLIFVLGSLRLLPFTALSCYAILIVCAVFFYHPLSKRISKSFDLKRTALRLRRKWNIFLFEEVIFLTVFLFWAYVRAHLPDIHGLEKFMDYGFLNSILRTTYFPPKDMWFTPYPINYYFFGHLTTAVLTKLSQLPSFVTYNLMLATLAGLCFSLAFSIGYNLFAFFETYKGKTDNQNKTDLSLNSKWSIGKALICGLLAGTLITFSGNLHTIYTFFKPYQNEDPVPFYTLAFSPATYPNAYWYPNATRFIYHTIHEFPIYSFVVSDLHGHVLSIPMALLIIALICHELLKTSKSLSRAKIIFFAFLVAVAYMTNAWDGIIYFLLISLSIFCLLVYKKSDSTSIVQTASFLTRKTVIATIKPFLISLFVLGLGFFLFSLPFSFHFKPFVSGIGIVCAPPFLVSLQKLGPFLFEADHCQKSPFWQMAILYGFFYFFVISFIVFLFREKKANKVLVSDLCVLLLIILSSLLIVIPEFIYIKDIYPEHYRANTMFKLVYQAFMMLSLASGYITVRIVTSFLKLRTFSFFPKVASFVWIIVFLGFFYMVLSYPYFAITSYYGNFKIYYGLNGISYLKTLYPQDYTAIMWITSNIQGQPVILEAQGDSYTDYARISANTGLPTILGWTVHEWLWRGTYDIPAPRISEVQNIYESSDLQLTKNLLQKYHVSLVYIGTLERQKYPLIKETKFQQLGQVIFQDNQTKLYKLY